MENNTNNMDGMGVPPVSPTVPESLNSKELISEQLVANQNEGDRVQIVTSKKPSIFKNKKFIFVVVIPIVVTVVGMMFILSKVGTNFIMQNKYELIYVPAGWSKGQIQITTDDNREKTYSITYLTQGGGQVMFAQIYNSTSFNCTRSPKANSSISEYSKFTPEGASDGCVHSYNVPEYKVSGKNYEWLKDGVDFKLNTVNYDLSEEEALRMANSIQLKTNIQK